MVYFTVSHTISLSETADFLQCQSHTYKSDLVIHTRNGGAAIRTPFLTPDPYLGVMDQDKSKVHML